MDEGEIGAVEKDYTYLKGTHLKDYHPDGKPPRYEERVANLGTTEFRYIVGALCVDGNDWRR